MKNTDRIEKTRPEQVGNTRPENIENTRDRAPRPPQGPQQRLPKDWDKEKTYKGLPSVPIQKTKCPYCGYTRSRLRWSATECPDKKRHERRQCRVCSMEFDAS